MSETKKPMDVIAVLKQPEIRSAIVPLFQKHVTPERFFAMAISSAKAFAKKENVVPESILVAIYQAAKLGLEPDDSLGHAHLVPFASHGKVYATLIPGYRGLIHLARRSGKVRDIKAFIVYEADGFDYHIQDGITHFTYKPTLAAERGKPIAGVAITYWTDNSEPRIDIMPYCKIDKIAKAQITKCHGKTPWTTHREEMDVKTVIRHTCKFLPQTPELAKAVSYDENLELGRLNSDVPDALTDAVGAKYREEVEKVGQPEPSKPETTAPKSKSEKMDEAGYLEKAHAAESALYGKGWTAKEVATALAKKGLSTDVDKAPKGDWQDIVTLLEGS